MSKKQYVYFIIIFFIVAFIGCCAVNWYSLYQYTELTDAVIVSVGLTGKKAK